MSTRGNEIVAVLRQALEALEATMSTHGFAEYIEEAKEKAITSLRVAIANYSQAIEQIEAEKQELDDLTIAYMSGLYDGKKKRQEAEKQEPVAWPEPLAQPPIYADEDPEEQLRATRYRAGFNDCLEKCKAVYTSPPQRPAAVGEDIRKPLTDDEIDLKCLSITGFLTRRERDRHVWKMAAAHGIKEKNT